MNHHTEHTTDRHAPSAATLPLPGHRVPDLRAVRLGDGQTFDIQVARPKRYTLLVFYRGVHCPICRTQLEALDGQIGAFRERDVDVIALSCDDEERARKAAREWSIERVPLAYGVNLDHARDWGLFVSEAIGDHEPRRFCEPGLFLVDRDAKLYAAWVQSAPFARPAFDDVLSALDFIREKDYPPRGTVPASA